MTPPPLYLSHDSGLDWLIALEFGRVDDAQNPDCWRGVSGGGVRGHLHDAPGGRVVGFKVLGFSGFEAEDAAVAEIWADPRFDVPVLGLANASAGEVVLAARTFFDGRDSLNRMIFGVATRASGEEAGRVVRQRPEAGDAMAHFALGYTLYELGHHQDAYRHLRLLHGDRAARLLELAVVRLRGPRRLASWPRRAAPTGARSSWSRPATTRPTPASCWRASRRCGRRARARGVRPPAASGSCCGAMSFHSSAGGGSRRCRGTSRWDSPRGDRPKGYRPHRSQRGRRGGGRRRARDAAHLRRRAQRDGRHARRRGCGARPVERQTRAGTGRRSGTTSSSRSG